ncbi:MAG: proline racemase [Candidatus Methanogaster sp.]|uniref:Proline racemase n=1 Tax=Candidatus Methanogaster sp. TaxID=3386292 RepID=A0AC61L6K4_9EURY|nr:MAG: proline racemase [ANME-2 cluster archaeon]
MVDTHTGGEQTRIVLGGFSPVNCDSMIERLEYIKENLDWIRTCVLFEPRGSMDSFGAIVLPPIDKRAEFSLILMNTLGYMYMCGHATIGVAGALAKLGYIRMEEPETKISFETVAGIVNVRLHVKDSVIEKISVVEPPSFFVKNMSLRGWARCRLTKAFGGNFFAIANADSLGIRVEMKNIGRLIELGLKIRDEVNRLEEIIHPENPYIRGVDLTMIYEKTGHEKLHYREVTIFGDGEFDRSPCGTGTAARMACLYDRVMKGCVYSKLNRSHFCSILVLERKYIPK